MRCPEYISPSSFKVFYEDIENYYLDYLAENRPPRRLQTQPMSIGSSFDAYVKSYLFEIFYGRDLKYDFETLFNSQVEEHNREWALEHGAYVFKCYKESGALLALVTDLKHSDMTPKFEFEVRKVVDGVPLLGKPDLYFLDKDGRKIIYDWKVNGYCSKYNTSPKPGYKLCRDGWSEDMGPHSRSHMSQHNLFPLYMEAVDVDWANQLAIYGWVLGFEVGSTFVVGVDQLCCSGGPKGKIRIAQHRSFIGKDWQKQLIEQLTRMWVTIKSGHIFRNLTREQSDSRCKILDEQHKAYESEHVITREY